MTRPLLPGLQASMDAYAAAVASAVAAMRVEYAALAARGAKRAAIRASASQVIAAAAASDPNDDSPAGGVARAAADDAARYAVAMAAAQLAADDARGDDAADDAHRAHVGAVAFASNAWKGVSKWGDDRAHIDHFESAHTTFEAAGSTADTAAHRAASDNTGGFAGTLAAHSVARSAIDDYVASGAAAIESARALWRDGQRGFFL